MIDDIIREPLAQYRQTFKSAHAQHTAAYFEDLFLRSGVDAQANAQTVQALRELEKQAKTVNSHRGWWRAAMWLSIIFAVIAAFVALGQGLAWVLLPAAIFSPLIYWLRGRIQDAQSRLEQLQALCQAQEAQAWAQMEPLNALFGWDIPAKLTQKTVPRLAFDPSFTQARMNELCQQFGWSGDLGKNKSILSSHSGVINGNPFILSRALAHWMGSKTYEGSLNISWTETVRDSNGQSRTVTRHQTLHASLTKPFPEYDKRTFIIYGNEAAPDLSFSRQPSKLSKLDDGFFDKMRKNRAIKKLEKKSRDIDEDGKSFTVMANREFDALFNATDRDHETQFRLLFTPLAQQEMLHLLKDKEVGYGDNFAFDKVNMINIVEPTHMRSTDTSGEPERFHFYELAESRQFFNAFNNDFVRSFYFGIAPLLAIPLYQQHRSHADIYKDVYADRLCSWEHEAIANHHGQAKFEHPNCVTRSILKTSAEMQADGSQIVSVTASGFRSEDRLDYVCVLGGDGSYHRVPVHWHEYFSVERSAEMLVKDQPEPDTSGAGSALGESVSEDTQPPMDIFALKGITKEQQVTRRSIVSALLS